MKEWVILFPFSMVPVMHINRKSRKQQKVETNFGRQLKDISITIGKIMIDNNKLIFSWDTDLIQIQHSYGKLNLRLNIFLQKESNHLNRNKMDFSKKLMHSLKMSIVLIFLKRSTTKPKVN